MFKILTSVLLLILAYSYTEQNHILILNGEELQRITEEFTHIFIKYYAPQCGYCQQLAPLFKQIAEQFHQNGSIIRLAKIDCDSHPQVSDFQEIKGYPTLVFYKNGQSTNYQGELTKDSIVRWLQKRLRDPVIRLTLQQYQELKDSTEEKVSLVFFGSLETVPGILFTNLARFDEYNDYYFLEDEDQSYASVEILRNFDEDSIYSYADEGLAKWITSNERPIVVPLDDRSINHIFAVGNIGVFLFYSQNDLYLLDSFIEAATFWRDKEDALNNLIFVAVSESNPDYENLRGFLEITPEIQPIIVINGQIRTKYILEELADKLTSDAIIYFIAEFQNGNIFELTLDPEQNHEYDNGQEDPQHVNHHEDQDYVHEQGTHYHDLIDHTEQESLNFVKTDGQKEL